MASETQRAWRIADLILRYRENTLSPDETEELERWLAESPEHREQLENLNTPVFLQQKYRQEQAIDTAAAYAAFSKRIAKERPRKLRKWYAWTAVAASVVILTGMTVLFLLNRTSEKDTGAPVVARVKPGKAQVTLEMASGARFVLDTFTSTIRNDKANVAFENSEGTLRIEEQADTLKENVFEAGNNKIIVPYGGTYSLILADGTKVYLNSGTELEFPSRFSKEKRQVVLKGEAYFEVVRNEHQPFVVQVGEMAVKVLGTSFNVKSYVDEPGVYTTLVEGSVAIVRKEQPERKIVPGEQAYYNKGVGTLSVSPVNVTEFIAWKDGFFFFKDLPLEEILRIVSRWYDLEVFYVNQGAKSVVYSGKLPMYSSVEDVLRKFEISGEVRFELKGRTLMVYDYSLVGNE